MPKLHPNGMPMPPKALQSTTRKQRLITYVTDKHYSKTISKERRKQFAREYINSLSNLEFLDLLDEAFKEENL